MRDPTTATRPIAYSYQRFSSPAQWSGDSITRQHLMATEYAKAHDLHLDESLTIRDLGVSGFRGKNAETGALAKFLQAVHSQHVPSGSFLLIECLDRLSRAHILMAQSILSQLILAGIKVVSLVDHRVYSTDTLAKDPISLLYALIVFARANEESAMKSVRAREAWKRKREVPRSSLITSHVPDWLVVDAATNKIAPHEGRVALLRQVFAAALEGQSATDIARSLNQSGVRRWRGDHQWSGPTVSTLLRNPRVTGVLPLFVANDDTHARYARPDRLIAGYFPQVIKPDRFLAVQEILRKRRRGGSVARNSILADIMRCAECGAVVRYQAFGKNGRPVLRCQAALLKYQCTSPEVDYSLLENKFIETLRVWLRTVEPKAVYHREKKAIHAAILDLYDAQEAVRNSAITDGGGISYNRYLVLAKAEGQLDDLLDYGVSKLTLDRTQKSKILAAIDDGISSPVERHEVNRWLKKTFSVAVIDSRNCRGQVHTDRDVVMSW
jgi:DNA invertase Pin-like site-specific DNA recombinase